MKFNLPFALLNIAILVVMVSSCKKFDDRHKQFFEMGETIYIAKADSIKLKGGNGRIELSWLMLADPKISSYKVYWNNRRDSLSGSVQKTENVDTVKMMINNMNEGTYQFEIINYDKVGNKSIPALSTGKVYGARFQQSLLPRVYKSFKRVTNNLEFIWMPSEANLLHVEIKYINSLGQPIQVFVPRKEEVYTLLNFPVGGTMQYRSVFLPDPMAIDMFTTEFQTFKE